MYTGGQELTEVVDRFTIGDCGPGGTDPATCLNVRHHACRRANGSSARSEERKVPPGTFFRICRVPLLLVLPSGPGRLLAHMDMGL